MSASGYDVTEKELAFIKSVVASFASAARKSKCWERQARLEADGLRSRTPRRRTEDQGSRLRLGLAGHADSEIILRSSAPLKASVASLASRRTPILETEGQDKSYFLHRLRRRNSLEKFRARAGFGRAGVRP